MNTPHHTPITHHRLECKAHHANATPPAHNHCTCTPTHPPARTCDMCGQKVPSWVVQCCADLRH